MTRAFECSWLSDDPLSDLDDEELFGRTHLIDRILEVLDRVRDQSTSSTIGLVGSWGSGKTSVLDGLTGRLRSPGAKTTATLREKWRVAEFNPWLYSGPLELHVGFFQTLRNAFSDDEKWSNKKDWFLNLGKAAAPLAGLAGLVGIDGESIARQLLDSATDSLVQQRDKIATALEEAQQPVLLVVDDLDRLSAEELLHLFKLVRLVGRLPCVYYLLSYDEHTVIDLLAKTDLVAANDDRRALDYLEKIVQVRLDMPLLRSHEIDRVVQRSINRIATNHRLPISHQQTHRLTNIFDEVLSHRLRTPRAIKRMFGQVDAFLGSLGEEVDFDDFLIITWLRTIEPGVYGLIQRHKNELLSGGGFTLRNAHLPELQTGALRDIWLKRLSDARVDDASLDDLLYLLQTLFPRLEPIYRNEDRDRHSTPYAPEPKVGRVSHPDYFDRYFSFGVPSDDIADAFVRAGIQAIANGDLDAKKAVALAEIMRTQPELAIRKMFHVSDALNLSSVPVVRWLATWWLELQRGSLTSSRLEGLCASIVCRLDTDQIRELAADFAQTVDGAFFVACVTHAAEGGRHSQRGGHEEHERVSQALLDGAVPRYAEHLATAAMATSSPLHADERVRDLLLYWRLHSPKTLKSALQDRMEGGWEVVDTIAWLLPLRDFRNGQQQLSEFGDLSYLTALFDMTFVLTNLNCALNDAADYQDLLGQPATEQLRREGALALVKLAVDAEAGEEPSL